MRKKADKLINQHIRYYKRINKAKIGFFESIHLKINGKRDGKNGFPRLIDNIWYSTFIDSEVNTYSEFSSYIWSTLQIENKEKYIELRKLSKKIEENKKQLKEIRNYLNEINKNKVDLVRKKGEEQLTDDQIRYRRFSEIEKSLFPIKKKIADIENQLQIDKKIFLGLRAELNEAENTVRGICDCVKNHIVMRIDIYWKEALFFHDDSLKIPVTPSVIFSNEAEKCHIKRHEILMNSEECQSEKNKEVA